MQPSTIMRHFVLKEPRPKQVVALEYIERKYLEGYRDIVISAPTGVGKSFCGATCAFWGASEDLAKEKGDSGAYYLVCQKMLQDQLQNDIPRYIVPNASRQCRSIKTAAEYLCPEHGNCAIGLNSKIKCNCVMSGVCPYLLERAAWGNAVLAITNYPYLFTEHRMVGKLPPRKVLILDEAHALEKQILRFIEVSISQESLNKWAPALRNVPQFTDVLDFADYMTDTYLPVIENKIADLETWECPDDSPESRKTAQEKLELTTHHDHVKQSADIIKSDPDNWVFSQGPNQKEEIEAVAKPLNAAPFSQKLLLEMGSVRIYMSAYPGSKRVFCRSLGLDTDSVAWINLSSTFPVGNRHIYITPTGSMSRQNRPNSMSSFLYFTQEILDCHADTKGIIHCHSYELGQDIYNALLPTPHGKRLIFPKSAEARDSAFQTHKDSKEPTIIISPSMTEGFDFVEDLARWQIIAKVPYPYLGDSQVAAKKEMDADWYILEAVKTIVQACGRIIRSDTDFGETYLLDSDFEQLYEKYEYMFPKWWSEALVFPKRKPAP